LNSKEDKSVFPALSGHCTVVLDQPAAIYNFGGVDDYGDKNAEVYRYCLINNKWTHLEINTSQFAPKARSGCNGVDIGNQKILFFGGCTEKVRKHSPLY